VSSTPFRLGHPILPPRRIIHDGSGDGKGGSAGSEEVRRMVHRKEVGRYPGTLAELAAEVGDLRYDALAEFLRVLSAKLGQDAGQDEGRGRARLAASLHDASRSLREAAEAIERAWRICEPHMAWEEP
jgi:hypothetical protein